MLEVLPIGASKGHGLGLMLAALGIDAARVAAVGDGDNDETMLRLVRSALPSRAAHGPNRAACVVNSPEHSRVTDGAQRTP